MKPNSKNASLSTKVPIKANSENNRPPKEWRKIGLRLAAIFMIIAFLASECAALLPVT